MEMTVGVDPMTSIDAPYSHRPFNLQYTTAVSFSTRFLPPDQHTKYGSFNAMDTTGMIIVGTPY